ncbi:MAG: hypothetical protein ACFFD2_14970 [Promethearchaeota archaeon]
MKKRNAFLAVFCIVLFLLVISFLPVAHCYNYIFDDAEDDVYFYCSSTDDLLTGDYHDEIDITNLNITGQYVSFTVAGSFNNWSSNHWGVLTFSSKFLPMGGPIGYAWTPPYYRLEFDNYTSFFVTLEKGYSLGGGNFAYEEWNGTAWENQTTATPENILYDITQHTVTAYIPDAVEEIPSSMKCLLYTEFWGPPFDCGLFVDFAPALPTSDGGGSNIPGYNLFLLISLMIGVTFYLLRKKYKLK